MNPPIHIAIIGAGMAGAVLAHELRGVAGIRLTVFDKSRGIGGRMSTRYGEHDEYDHGAQFFTARSKPFQSLLATLSASNVVTSWEPKVVTLEKQRKPYKRLWFEPHYVATPRMNDMCKHLLQGIDVHHGVKIDTVTSDQNQHHLTDDKGTGYGPFDWLIATAPAEQTTSLIPASATDLGQVQFAPCFALMVPWHTELPNWHAATIKDNCLAWLCFNQTKPGRTHKPTLLVHSRGDWAEQNLRRPIAAVKSDMLDRLTEFVTIADGTETAIHRWRYAQTSQPLNQPFWLLAEQRLAACGDWCLGSTVEDAFRSASALATHLKQLL
ncbi:MAG: NAD(P)/FAD-dependent oxidoreductase [Pseudomonadales bacterium]